MHIQRDHVRIGAILITRRGDDHARLGSRIVETDPVGAGRRLHVIGATQVIVRVDVLPMPVALAAHIGPAGRDIETIVDQGQ